MSSSVHLPMLMIAIAWLAIVVFTIRRTVQADGPGIGLPTAFLLSMSFLYCGAFIYIIPGYTHLRGDGLLSLGFASWNFTEQTVLQGALLALLGTLGFAIGAVFLVPRFRLKRPGPPREVVIERIRLARKPLMISLGVLTIAGFAITASGIKAPLVDAISLTLRSMAVIIVCLGATFAIFIDRKSPKLWISLGVLIPLIYLVVWGFTSYGFIALTVCIGFWLAVVSRRRVSIKGMVVIGGLATYGLLMLFVAWMSYREEIRSAIWGGASLTERVSVVADGVQHTRILLPTDFESLDWLNLRLNQGLLVGKAIEMHAAVPELRLYGETIVLSAAAVVPRFLWPEKPTMGQSAFVAENTGLTFARSANFGSGAVFEFFVNFGWAGVFVGFMALGYIVRRIDRSAGRALAEGRLIDCARSFLVGLALIAPLTTIFFMVNGALVSWFVMTGLKYVLRNELRGHAPGLLKENRV